MKVTLETPKKEIQNYFHNFFDIESGNRYIQNPTIFFSYTFFFFFEVGGKWQHRNSFKIKNTGSGIILNDQVQCISRLVD